jgi:hypothetical protein
MTAKRIYLVTGGEWPRLVLASSQAQAINHCVRGTFTAKVASQMDIVETMSDSSRSIVGVEDAGEEQE